LNIVAVAGTQTQVLGLGIGIRLRELVSCYWRYILYQNQANNSSIKKNLRLLFQAMAQGAVSIIASCMRKVKTLSSYFTMPMQNVLQLLKTLRGKLKAYTRWTKKREGRLRINRTRSNSLV